MPRMPPLLPTGLALALAACATFPALDARIPAVERDAPYPALLPLGPLLAQADAMAANTRTGDAALAADTARTARLRARAAALRGPVIDSATRDRMRRGVDDIPAG